MSPNKNHQSKNSKERTLNGMKLTVTQENLNKALLNVSRIASTKTPLPVLSNILLKTDKNRLLIAATNLEVAITEFIGAKVEQQGSITIPARLMSEFINNLPKGNVELQTKDLHLHITSDHFNSTINGVGADDFPELPSIDEASSTQIRLETNVLKQAVSQTVIASSSDNTRPMLTGGYLHTFKGDLYLAATDGYRLAERKLLPCKDTVSAIIPVSSLNEIVRIMPDDSTDIQLVIDENQIRFRVESIELTSRLIDATYVDYRQLIPEKSDTNCLIKKDEFSRITKVAGLFARESAGGITIKADSQHDTLSIHSIASQLGENTSEAEAKVDTDGSVTLNSHYLSEALSAINDSEVRFRFSGKLAPCVLTDTKQGSNYKHIVMPLKS